jgi:hypothetical protein
MRENETAIQWLIETMQRVGEVPFWLNQYLSMAEKIEQQQMIDAYSNGWHDGQDVILQQCKHIDKGGDDAGQKYYNETYKGGEQ